MFTFSKRKYKTIFVFYFHFSHDIQINQLLNLPKAGKT